MTESNLQKFTDAYRDQGYAIIPQCVPSADMAAFRAKAAAAFDAEPWLDLRSKPAVGEDPREVMIRRLARLDELIPERRGLMLSNIIQTYLHALMDDDPFLISQGIPFKYSLSHASYDPADHDPNRNGHLHNYSHVEPARACVMAWFAMEDIALEAGPMWVCPGSHKQNDHVFDDILAANPKLNEELFQLRETGGPYTNWVAWFTRMQKIMTALIEDSIDAEHRRRVPVLVNAGDLVFFDPALSHGTIAPTDLERTRWSFVAKYQGRHAIERSWASWLGRSIYLPALQHIPPATFEIRSLESGAGYYATDPIRDHLKMFWRQPLQRGQIPCPEIST